MSRDRDERNWTAITLDAGARRAPKGDSVTTELAVREPAPVPASPGLFGTDNPKAVISKAATVAGLLKDVVDKQGLIKNISGKQYILAEGWTTLGAMVGVFPKVEYSNPVLDQDGNKIGWEAAVEVVNAQGVVIGRAEAQCLREERNWKGRDDFALRSMAQTRAMGKALRMPLGFIAAFAGYEATPAEEMPDDSDLPFEVGPGEGARPAAAVKAGAAPVVPFEPGVTGTKTGRAQDPSPSADPPPGRTAGTGAAGDFATQAQIDEMLELAAQIGGDELHTKACEGVGKQRNKHADQVPLAYVKARTKDLLAKVAA